MAPLQVVRSRPALTGGCACTLSATRASCHQVLAPPCGSVDRNAGWAARSGKSMSRLPPARRGHRLPFACAAGRFVALASTGSGRLLSSGPSKRGVRRNHFPAHFVFVDCLQRQLAGSLVKTIDWRRVCPGVSRTGRGGERRQAVALCANSFVSELSQLRGGPASGAGGQETTAARASAGAAIVGPPPAKEWRGPGRRRLPGFLSSNVFRRAA